jgi:hypothetical protein
MSLAIDPNDQPRVTELEIRMLERLRRMDNINAELAMLFRQHFALTGDPATAQAMGTAAKIDAEFRRTQ